jgi:hypothetical protein
VKYTLLEMVQQILSSMDSDEVDNYNDTTESTQVANIIKTTYWDIISRLDPPEHYDFYQLTETSASTPTIMTLPSSQLSIEWIKYNQQADADTTVDYQEVTYLDLNEFLRRMYGLDADGDTVDGFSYTINSKSQNFMCLNDRAPSYYTTWDDGTVLFDAYNSDNESFLEATKTMVYGYYLPTFTMSNSFTPDLDAKNFSLLFNEAKSQAFIELKQVRNSKADERARGGWIASQKNKRNTPVNELDRLPNYGRR